MSPRTSLVAGTLLAALCFTGCNPAGKVVGKWKSTGVSGSPIAGLLGSAVKGEVEFKADGNCISSVSLEGEAIARSGTWRFVKADGETLVLMVKLSSGQEQELRLEFTDNDHFSMVPELAKEVKIEFAREK